MIIGIDTGGTFTDFFWLESGEIHVSKEPSTPDDPSRAILNGLRRAERKFSIITHGTTVATNSVLERKGAEVLLLCTEGFEDVIEIGRQNRSDIYDLNVDRSAPLVDRDHRIGIPERMDFKGNVLKDLIISDELIDQIKEIAPDSVAVCYLFSYVDSTHEKRTRQIFMEAGLETYWSLSSEVIPEYREYERWSTTVINAFVTPVMDKYIGSLQEQLEVDHLRIMQSNGGSMSAEAARRQSVQTLLSGPAGGVVAAKTIAEQCGLTNVISFDMGGTSTDVSFLPGHIQTTDAATIDDLPVMLPMINIHTVGAGGGSIAYQDKAGVLHVGPESAGAEPGPVCYDKGGNQLTVTDAHLLTGHLQSKSVFGNTITLNKEKTEQIAENIASDLNISAPELAESILAVANARMERAIRVISVEQGYDPGDAALITFGGAGPLHGCAIAESLSIPEVIVPVHAGVFSAFGLLWADVVRDATQTHIVRSPNIDWKDIQSRLQKLQKQVESDLLKQGLSKNIIRFEWWLELRYQGQSYQLEIPWDNNPEAMIESFHRRHNAKYQFRDDERVVEVVTLKVKGIGEVEKPGLPTFELDEQPVPKTIQTKIIGFHHGESQEFTLIKRDDLHPGYFGEGPCIIPEQTSTTFVPPHWQFRVDEYQHLRLTRNDSD